jgi:AAA ATPase containing von Willebrand factor type A (vWA) domain
MDPMTKRSQSEANTHQDVQAYLSQVSQSLLYFVQDEESDDNLHHSRQQQRQQQQSQQQLQQSQQLVDDDMSQHTATSLSDAMDQITSRLLVAGDPLLLSRPIPTSLSPPILYDSRKRVKPPRLVTKVDVLRNILYSMAPIALDVAAAMSQRVVRSLNSILMDQKEIEKEQDGNCAMNVDDEDDECHVEDILTRVFCIYSFWLPIAPQIRQIVVDLFQYSSKVDKHGMESQSLQRQQQRRKVFAHPLNGKYIQSFVTRFQGENINDSHGNDDHEKDVLLDAVQVWTQAVHCLLEYFAKEGDVKILQDCWNWTNLFCILGFTSGDCDDGTSLEDVDMEIENEKKMIDMDEEKDLDEMQHDDSYGPNGWAQRPYSPVEAIRWFAARAVADLLNLTPTSKGLFLKRIGLEEEMVPWVRHPWILLEEETNWQDSLLLEGVAVLVRFGQEFKVKVPTASEIRKVGISLPETLVHLGQGIVMPRLQTAVCQGQVSQYGEENDVCMNNDNHRSDHRRQGLVMTETTCRNLALLGTALCTNPYPPPILVCGPRGSGKSSLIRELTKLCNAPSHGTSASSEAFSGDNLLELHVDEETDSKTLLGSYAATDIPGEFIWRPGALTNAVRSGKWVLLEDVESCPAEIQAALVKLFEERILPLGVGKNEKCHPNFRLFGTCTTSSFLTAEKQLKNSNNFRRLRHSLASVGSSGKKLLHPGLWRKVHVEPLPYSELQIVSKEMFPQLPQVVSDAALNVFRQLDKSGRLQDNDETNVELGLAHHQPTVMNGHPILGNGRSCSVRDLMKLLARISSTVHFEPGATFCTESQRLLCIAESYDIFAGWCPSRNLRRDFTTHVLAPTWGITPTAAARYIESRQPNVTSTSEYVEVGRATIARPPSSATDDWKRSENSSFAETNYSLRLMESAGVCIAQNEPTLLVGGKYFLGFIFFLNRSRFL